MPNRSDALTALLAAQTKPVTKVESAPSYSSTSGHCGTLGQESLSRVRDRATVRENLPPEAKQETQYEQEVRLFGKYWADIYRDQREAKTREERIAAEKARVAAAHRIEDQRRIESAKAIQARNSKWVGEELLRGEIKGIFKSMDAFDIVEPVMALVRSWRMEKFPPAYRTAIEQIKQAEVAKVKAAHAAENQRRVEALRTAQGGV